MGNYRFMWKEIAANGVLESVNQQTIFGNTLSNACEYFESFHGPIGPDENGVSIEIISVTLETESNQ